MLHGRFKRLNEKLPTPSRSDSFWKIERLGKHLTPCFTQSGITRLILGKKEEISRSKKSRRRLIPSRSPSRLVPRKLA